MLDHNTFTITCTVKSKHTIVSQFWALLAFSISADTRFFATEKITSDPHGLIFEEKKQKKTKLK